MGVTELLAAVKAPVPFALMPATLKTYAVPLVNDDTTWLAVVDAVRPKVVQLLPLFEEYCTV